MRKSVSNKNNYSKNSDDDKKKKLPRSENGGRDRVNYVDKNLGL